MKALRLFSLAFVVTFFCSLSVPGVSVGQSVPEWAGSSAPMTTESERAPPPCMPYSTNCGTGGGPGAPSLPLPAAGWLALAGLGLGIRYLHRRPD